MQVHSGMRAVVIGLGTAGLSTVRHLLRRGVTVAVSEQRPAERIDPAIMEFLARNQVTLECGGHTEAILHGADFVVPGPGVPLDLPILARARGLGLPLLGELALAAGEFPVPVIALTGSNGKTTTTGLIGELLARAGRRPFVGGNIGTPLLDFFAEPFRPDIGLLLNVSPDHIDRHGSLAAYTAAKMRLFAHQRPGDTAVLGADDPVVDATRVPAGVAVHRFGTGEGCAARIDGPLVHLRLGDRVEDFDLGGTRLHSSVNRQNAASGILAAALCGCSREAIAEGLRAFAPPPHRMAEVATVDGVRFIDDSKATNIGALQAALAGCDRPVVLIAGGRDKGGDYALLREVVGARVKRLVLIGEAAPLMREALAPVVPCESAGDMADAVRRAVAATAPGDLVLLAPGCASFDMFSGYAERGRVFVDCVRRLQAERAGRGEVGA
jgi:UDP-N-acetylmuramoylalanine--D-glutamate ligase